jgi:hypothetical protein
MTDLLSDEVDELVKAAIKEKRKKLYPSLPLINKILKIIENFIIEKGRILYGGMSHNYYLSLKDNPIYDSDVLPDYDIYTPDPIQDVIDICNILHKNGFKYITGSEAVHGKTYKVFAETEAVFDLSYVPTNIYNKLAYTVGKDKLKYLNMDMLFIDIYRQYSDPLISYDYRLKKIHERKKIMDKFYPVKSVKEQVKYDNSKLDPKNEILRFIYKSYIKNKKNLIVIGNYAYTYYILKTKEKDGLPITHFDVISDTALEDAKSLQIILHKEYGDKLSIEEYSQFFQFLGYKYTFLYNGKPMLNIYDNMSRCLTINKIHNETVNISSYSSTLLHLYIFLFQSKINNKQNDIKLYTKLIYKFTELYKKYKDTYSNLFVKIKVNCVGKTQTSEKIKQDIIQQRRKNRQPFVWRYYPAQKLMEKQSVPFKFVNESGNKVINENYLRL